MKHHVLTFFIIMVVSILAISCPVVSENPTTYSVTYNGNGNTDGTPPNDSGTYGSGDRVTVVGNTDLVLTNNTFDGWNTLSDGTGTDYQTTDTFLMQESDLTLYAQWVQTEYAIGDIGPANGIIFYDNDADNESGNTDGLFSNIAGWRYLEAAPYDMATTGIALSSPRAAVSFGYHRDSETSENLFVNGTDTFSSADCTGLEIGDGKENTEMLVSLMGSTAYIQESGAEQGAYAAYLCDQLEYGGYSDWFLPSSDELKEMKSQQSIIGNFQNSSLGSYYWSSSEGYQANYTGDGAYAWYTDFLSTGIGYGTVSNLRSWTRPVRSIRRF